MPSDSLALLLGWMLLPVFCFYPARFLMSYLVSFRLSPRHARFYLFHPFLMSLDLIYAYFYAKTDQESVPFLNFLVGLLVVLACVHEAGKAQFETACRMLFNQMLLLAATLVSAGVVAKFI